MTELDMQTKLGTFIDMSLYRHCSVTIVDRGMTSRKDSVWIQVRGADDHKDPFSLHSLKEYYFGPPGLDYQWFHTRNFPFKYLTVDAAMWIGETNDKKKIVDSFDVHIRAVDFDYEDLEEAAKYIETMLVYRPAHNSVAPHHNTDYDDAEEFIKRIQPALENAKKMRESQEAAMRIGDKS